MSIGTFIIIKNEIPFIGAHLASVLPHVDEMVFYDGNSTDGTLEVIHDFQKYHPDGHKIKLFLDKDPKDLKDDYVKLFDQCMRSLSTDYAWFLHPDMIVVDPGRVRNLPEGIAGTVNMDSFGGEPDGKLYKIIEGRTDRWKSIYRLKNPDLGAHYWGHYGAANEDVYFSEITGGAHVSLGSDFNSYPYPIFDSGIKLLHFSDVRPYQRRFGRMRTCLIHQGYPLEQVDEIAKNHPRVTLKDGKGFKFEEAEYPEVFGQWKNTLAVNV